MFSWCYELICYLGVHCITLQLNYIIPWYVFELISLISRKTFFIWLYCSETIKGKGCHNELRLSVPLEKLNGLIKRVNCNTFIVANFCSILISQSKYLQASAQIEFSSPEVPFCFNGDIICVNFFRINSASKYCYWIMWFLASLTAEWENAMGI